MKSAVYLRTCVVMFWRSMYTNLLFIHPLPASHNRNCACISHSYSATVISPTAVISPAEKTSTHNPNHSLRYSSSHHTSQFLMRDVARLYGTWSWGTFSRPSSQHQNSESNLFCLYRLNGLGKGFLVLMRPRPWCVKRFNPRKKTL